jgi:hypothetical protein
MLFGDLFADLVNRFNNRVFPQDQSPIICTGVMMRGGSQQQIHALHSADGQMQCVKAAVAWQCAALNQYRSQLFNLIAGGDRGQTLQCLQTLPSSARITKAVFCDHVFGDKQLVFIRLPLPLLLSQLLMRVQHANGALAYWHTSRENRLDLFMETPSSQTWEPP